MSSNGWEKAKLGDICEVLTGFPFKSAKFNMDGKGVKLVRGKNVSKRYLRWGDDARWWDELNPTLEKYYLQQDDILIGMDGSLVGKNYVRVNKSELPLLLVQRVACIRAKKGYNQKFIYYQIANSNFENYIDFVKTGTTIPHISGSQLADYIIDFPPEDEQQAIAATLSCLDDKIELNNRINKNLEEMAQAIFKSWFIDFEPFQDGEFEDSMLGRIPKGWRVGTLSDLVVVRYGKDHKKLDDGDIPVFGSGGVMRYVNTSLYKYESVLIPRKGTLNNVMYINEPFWSVDTMFFTEMKL